MADSVTQIQSSYEKYKEYFATDTSTTLDQEDFLSLIVEQLKNQDFNNPTDNTEFIAQLAQFSTLKATQEMAYYSQASYASSLVGKTVAVGATDSSGRYVTDEGEVTSLKFNNNSFDFVVNGTTYSAKNIMEVKSGKADASGIVYASKAVNYGYVTGLSSLLDGVAMAVIGFTNGTQEMPIALSIVEGDADAVTEYTVGSQKTTLTIALKDLDSITSTSDLESRINEAIKAEIATPTDSSNPMMTSSNFTAGDISIAVDLSDVSRVDGTTFSTQDVTDVNTAATETLKAALSSSLTLE